MQNSAVKLQKIKLVTDHLPPREATLFFWGQKNKGKGKV
jgi:hypothetical protein